MRTLLIRSYFPKTWRRAVYVSISRVRERVQIFTDDTETLRRRVRDSRERKAALELAGLREELAKLGFQPKPENPSQEVVTPAADSRFRTIRALRPTRNTRLAPVQRIVQIAEDLAHWIAERVGLDQKQVVSENIAPDLTVKPAGTIDESPRPTRRRRLVPTTVRPSQSRGISI